jgi:hypothetical protein
VAAVLESRHEGLGRQGRGQRVRRRADEAVVEGQAGQLDGRRGPLDAPDQLTSGPRTKPRKFLRSNRRRNHIDWIAGGSPRSSYQYSMMSRST